MTLETMGTARLIEHCSRLDELLGRHERLWRSNAFRDPDPGWLHEHPRLAAILLDLSEADLQRLEANPEPLLELLDPHVRGLCSTLAATEPAWVGAEPAPDTPFSNLHVPGRKWAQIRHFMAALPPATAPAVDWCSGKGHLGRSVARLHGRPVRCLERDPKLCAAGRILAGGLPVTFERCDILQDSPQLGPGDTLLALHACGALHERMLDAAVAGGSTRIHLAPCCYHLTPAWKAKARGAPDPGFEADDLHRAVQDMVTAPARVRRARLRERAFRAGFDALQRHLRGCDSYLPQPSLKAGQRQLDFPGFCNLMARHHGLELPVGMDLPSWLEQGWIRDARSRRLELVSQGFRRVLELRIVLDRALFLAEAGYAVNLLRFCPRTLTPRNLLLQAWRAR
ncbi:MAG: methyltransferase [Gammaproteobacteria bacterium]|nr:methyltransferase [Gammaproteobacteria bacterium]